MPGLAPLPTRWLCRSTTGRHGGSNRAMASSVGREPRAGHSSTLVQRESAPSSSHTRVQSTVSIEDECGQQCAANTTVAFEQERAITGVTHDSTLATIPLWAPGRPLARVKRIARCKAA